ncbi:universal stress protein [Halobaculum sp. MBLA0147]|uniref:universal stress protein n=1 Tax=Halobaculum sp. MBLA0147 TaxID=3079934 RepID=UPI0035257214
MTVESVVIAVGRDEGERADELAGVAVELAATGAEVTLVHAFETQAAVDEAAGRLGLEDGSTADVARRLDSVRRVSRALDDAGVQYEVDARVGAVGEAVSEAAHERAADRVVVGGRDRSPTGKAVFGSSAQAVLLSAPCPVTFVRRDD